MYTINELFYYMLKSLNVCIFLFSLKSEYLPSRNTVYTTYFADELQHQYN